MSLFIVVVMRTILLAVALMGCGTDGPHDVVTCGSAWSDPAYSGQLNYASEGCERACETPPANYLQGGTPSCNLGSDAPTSHCNYFELADGTKGCCIVGVAPDVRPISFYECSPQP